MKRIKITVHEHKLINVFGAMPISEKTHDYMYENEEYVDQIIGMALGKIPLQAAIGFGKDTDGNRICELRISNIDPKEKEVEVMRDIVGTVLPAIVATLNALTEIHGIGKTTQDFIGEIFNQKLDDNGSNTEQ